MPETELWPCTRCLRRAEGVCLHRVATCILSEPYCWDCARGMAEGRYFRLTSQEDSLRKLFGVLLPLLAAKY